MTARLVWENVRDQIRLSERGYIAFDDSISPAVRLLVASKKMTKSYLIEEQDHVPNLFISI